MSSCGLDLKQATIAAVLRGAVPDAVPGHAAQRGQRLRAGTRSCRAASSGRPAPAPLKSLPEGRSGGLHPPAAPEAAGS